MRLPERFVTQGHTCGDASYGFNGELSADDDALATIASTRETYGFRAMLTLSSQPGTFGVALRPIESIVRIHLQIRPDATLTSLKTKS